MGNTHSAGDSHGQTPHPITRKRSAVFSRLHLIGTGHFSDSSRSLHDPKALTNSQESVNHFSEKPRIVHYHENHRPESPQFISPLVMYSPTSHIGPDDAITAYHSFLKEFPEYRLTWILDTLRRTDYGRLDRTGETYVDYMGGSLYPESLIRAHTDFLSQSILGNTHSVSNSSKLSVQYADEARATILSFFKAPPEYTVIFTPNASGALKLIGESYPFTEGGNLVIGSDSHNSVHGIRDFATHRGSRICYVPSTVTGGVDITSTKNILLRHRPQNSVPCLFVLTGQSNISNAKNSLALIDHAISLGYDTVLDAAALAPTTLISLSDTPVDAIAVSFYKMFGYPTGVGALVIKKSLLSRLKRPWFAGGTVDVVQVPGNIKTRSHELHEQFEDGTINYLSLPAVTDGLRFLSAYLPFLPLRLSSLIFYLINSLSQLRHDINGEPVVRILSRKPTRRLRFISEQSDTGSIISLLFLGPTGKPLSNSFIEYSASKQGISLRTGCMCNPGGAAALLGIEDEMRKLYPGVTLKDFENHMGRELGVVRISLGLASNFQDAWKVVQFANSIAKEDSRQAMWNHWKEETEATALDQ